MDAESCNAMLPENIRREIKRQGLRSKEVAKRAGLSEQQLSDMLHGRKIIKACDIIALSDALNIEVSKLFTKGYAMESGRST